MTAAPMHGYLSLFVMQPARPRLPSFLTGLVCLCVWWCVCVCAVQPPFESHVMRASHARMSGSQPSIKNKTWMHGQKKKTLLFSSHGGNFFFMYDDALSCTYTHSNYLCACGCVFVCACVWGEGAMIVQPPIATAADVGNCLAHPLSG